MVRHPSVGSGWSRTARRALVAAGAGLLACGGLGESSAHPERGMLPARWTDAQGQSREVPFSFEARGPGGEMFTTLGRGGEHFRGPFVHVRASTQGEVITEVYDGWSSPEWEAWQHEPDGDWVATATSFGEFAHFYTGRVVATLQGSEGHAMRCRLTLTNPHADLLESGHGTCQISDGGRLDLEF